MKTTTTNTLHKKIHLGIFILFGVGMLTLVPHVAKAALTANSTITQLINAGTLSTDFRTSAGVLVSNPTFAMNAVSVSNSQQTATGTYGLTEARIAVDNPDASDTGWTLTLNADTPATDVWTSGGNTYDFNAGSASAGQLTVNASAGTLTAEIGTLTGITKGALATFTSTSPITILSASSGADDITNTTLYGVTLSQTIPASTPAGSYSITMVQTLAAV